MKRAALVSCALVFAIAAMAQNSTPPLPVHKKIAPAQSNAQQAGHFHTNLQVVSLADPSDSGVVYLPQAVFSPNVGPPFTGVGSIETPASIACIYGFVTKVTGCDPAIVTALPTTKGSKAIAIVDAYHDPNALADLTTFSKQFGLPVPTSSSFTVVYQGSSAPSTDPTLGWEMEESLDIEYAHAMAPNAHIYLVEANSSSTGDLIAAVEKAATTVSAAGGGEISLSWGSSEFASETSYDADFVKSGVVVFASSGDEPGESWPCVSPNVVCVGGTTFNRNPATFAFEQETAWDSAGSGTSYYESLPSYQATALKTLFPANKYRLVPDVAALANPYTGAWICDSNGGLYGVNATCWYPVGGTSLASPLMAGIVNAAGSFKTSTAAELTAIYTSYASSSYSSQWNDINYGYCYWDLGFFAGKGWDLCTGVGSPLGYLGK
jgi:kumamolisin